MSDWNKNLAKEIAKGLINTGIEGGYDSVAKSTAYAYPSIGVSQWEGNRDDELLRAIPGGEEFIGRTYIDIKASGELPMLKEGVQALLRDRIIQAYNHYSDKGWIPIYAMESIEDCYKSYEELGDNGVIDNLMSQLRELPNHSTEV